MVTTDRRKFIGTLIGGVAASAAVRTWPFRVFSFPSEITIAEPMMAFGNPSEPASAWNMWRTAYLNGYASWTADEAIAFVQSLKGQLP